jgi:hypothetical protein
MPIGRSLLFALLLVLASSVASATPVQLVSGNVTYHLDDAQTGFTSFSASAGNGIDFNPDVSDFLSSGSTAFAFLDFQVFGNDAGGGNVFSFDDFAFSLSGTILPVVPPGSVDITLSGTVDVIGASQGGSNIGNPGLPDVNLVDFQASVTGPWASSMMWTVFDDFLDGTAYETAVATGLDFSLIVTITATNGISISQITDAMTDVGVTAQPGVPVPEPATGLMVALGLMALGYRGRARRR